MADKKYDIIGIGSPIVDSLAHVDEAFIENIKGSKGGMELVTSEEMSELISKVSGQVREAAGGSSGNTIFAMQRLGLSTAFLGKLGNGADGRFYSRSYQFLGGSTDYFKTGDIANARCLSLITPDSERTMRTDLGAAATLSIDEISSSDFSLSRHAHIEGYMLFNRDLMMHVLKCIQAADCSISLDLASFEVVGAARDILADILRDYVDVVFANEEEAAAFCGGGDDYEAMAQQLGELCRIAVVKLGKKGSLIYHEGDLVRVPAVKVKNAIDTTAAGDLWAAGFLYGWITGQPMAECGRYGSITSAEVVQVIGSEISDETWQGRILPALT
ncbi:MAG: adenosine kinase [Verrucomicrobiota bacterium]